MIVMLDIRFSTTSAAITVASMNAFLSHSQEASKVPPAVVACTAWNNDGVGKLAGHSYIDWKLLLTLRV